MFEYFRVSLSLASYGWPGPSKLRVWAFKQFLFVEVRRVVNIITVASLFTTLDLLNHLIPIHQKIIVDNSSYSIHVRPLSTLLQVVLQLISTWDVTISGLLPSRCKTETYQPTHKAHWAKCQHEAMKATMRRQQEAKSIETMSDKLRRIPTWTHTSICWWNKIATAYTCVLLHNIIVSWSVWIRAFASLSQCQYVYIDFRKDTSIDGTESNQGVHNFSGDEALLY